MSSGEGVRRERRASAVREMLFVIGCVLVAEWAVLPLFGRNLVAGLVPVVAAFVYMFLSHRARGESARALGWRVDNLPHALALLAPAMLLATCALWVVGRLAGDGGAWRFVSVGWPAFWTLVSLYVWGLMQQYALQAFINRRAQELWGAGARSVLFVAAVFALLHLPNLWLALACFAGGLLWAAVYQRAPNLWALALSHALMTVALAWNVPAAALHGLRVGAGYFR